MSKNMTQKGLAFGAGLALVLSGMAAVPAQAVVTGFITLEPTTGYKSAYAVPAGAAKTFSLTATQGPSAIFTNKELKFIVSDPEAKIEPAGASAGRTLITVDGDADLVSVDVSEKTVGLLDNSTNFSGVIVGDVVSFASNVAIDTSGDGTVQAGEILIPANTHVSVTDVTNKQITLSVPDMLQSVIDAGDLGTPAGTFDGVLNVGADADFLMRVSREKRAADNSFVVDTGVSDGTAQNLILSPSDSATRSVTVQAFADFVENDKIDELDYVSPERTVTFVAPADLTGSFSLTAPAEGATSISGTFSTTPLLNGTQTNDANLFAALFTRQGDPKVAAIEIGSTTQNTTTGLWPASVNTAAGTSVKSWTSDTAALTAASNWAHTAATNRAAGDIAAISVTTSKIGSITTDAVHNLKTGDKVTVTSTEMPALAETAAIVTVVSTTQFTFALTETADVTAASIADALSTAYTVVLSSDNVFPGDYSGQLAIDAQTDNKYVKVGSASSAAVLPVSAADVSFSTVASSVVQGISGVTTNDTNTDALIVNGTASAVVTATVLDSKGAAVGAGRTVNYSFDAGVSAGTVKVNGFAQSASKPALTTDANGQVAFTVTDTTGTDGKKVTISATPEGVSGAVSAFSFEWEKPALAMYDLNTSSASGLATSARTVVGGASYVLDLVVADQWFNKADAADYRVAVSGGGVTEGFVSLVDGRASVTVSDSGVQSSFVSKITLQKKGSTGAYANTTTSVDLTTATTSKGALNMSANGSAIFGTEADLSDAVAKKALVERDTRVAYVAQPGYVNDVVVVGKATNSSTGVALANSVVTISGPTSILFSNGAVDKRGSITVIADGSGQFAVNLYSTTAQKDTVITATANGVSATTKVTFTGIGVGEGTSLVITAPGAVKPASTFQVKAKLADAFGNGVDTAAGRVKVSYTGAGIIFGTLPTETDANGELSFSVLLGSNDTGTVSVSVAYDQNGDGDYVDAKDLNTSASIAINATGTVASTDTKVNAGSFKGFVAVYAKGYEGKRLSAKIGNDWVIVPSLASNFERITDFTGAGVNISVRIYIDRVLTETIPLVTK